MVSCLLQISIFMVRNEDQTVMFATLSCFTNLLVFTFSFLKYAGAIGKTWLAYWMSSVCGRIVPYFCPVFIPLILAAHSGLTSILNVILVRQHGLYFNLTILSYIYISYFYLIFLSCISFLYFCPVFLFHSSSVFLYRNSLLHFYLIFLSCIYLTHFSCTLGPDQHIEPHWRSRGSFAEGLRANFDHNGLA